MPRVWRRGRAGPPGWPVLMSSGVLLAAAMVVASRAGQGGHLLAAPVPPVPVGPHPPGRIPPAGESADATPLVAALATLAAVAVIALWRGRRRAAAVGRPSEEPTPLAGVVAAGSSALDRSADAREAIIACYTAMAEALATAGPRHGAASPEELLRRAVADGVVRNTAVERLTELFRKARFSPHEVAGTQRDAARAAIAEIGDEMAGRSRPRRASRLLRRPAAPTHPRLPR